MSIPPKLIHLYNIHPVSRETMRNLKAEFDESKRRQTARDCNVLIQDTMIQIYRDAVKKAETSMQTSYYYQTRDPLIIKCSNELTSGLKELFPGCEVSKMTVNPFVGMPDMAYMNINWY